MLNYPVCGTLLWQPWETNTGGTQRTSFKSWQNKWLPLRNEPINDYFSSLHFFQFSYTAHIFLFLKKKEEKKKVSTYPDKLVPEISLGEE